MHISQKCQYTLRALKHRCAFVGLWQEAQTAMEEVDDNTTLQDLIDDERTAAEQSDLPVYAV
jgi:DNA-binding IscR family transcriptional regulator